MEIGRGSIVWFWGSHWTVKEVKDETAILKSVNKNLDRTVEAPLRKIHKVKKEEEDEHQKH